MQLSQTNLFVKENKVDAPKKDVVVNVGQRSFLSELSLRGISALGTLLVFIFAKIFGKLFEVKNSDGEIDSKKVVVVVTIFFCLFVLIKHTYFVGLYGDPLVRTDDVFTINLNKNNEKVEYPPDKFFKPAANANDVAIYEMPSGRLYRVFYKTPGSDRMSMIIGRGMCQLVPRGQKVQLSSTSLPVLIIGMQNAGYWVNEKFVTKTWKDLERAWTSMDRDSNGTLLTSQTLHNEHGIICY